MRWPNPKLEKRTKNTDLCQMTGVIMFFYKHNKAARLTRLRKQKKKGNLSTQIRTMKMCQEWIPHETMCYYFEAFVTTLDKSGLTFRETATKVNI